MDIYNDNEAEYFVEHNAVCNEIDRQNIIKKELMEDLVDMTDKADREIYIYAMNLAQNFDEIGQEIGNENNINHFEVDDGDSEYTGDYSSDEDILDDLMDYDDTSDEDAGIVDMEDVEEEEEGQLEKQKVEEQVNFSTLI